jgi:hypothetical protein
MICQGCGYSLFNLARENCPECGRPFEVTDYRFEPGAVEFLCPDCNQPYPVIDERGLPRVGEFACLSCGAVLQAARMVVRPLTPTAEGRLPGSPWLRRDELGFWKGWWQTVVMTMLRPSFFFRTHPAQSTDEAFLFAAFSTLFGMVVGGSLATLYSSVGEAVTAWSWDPLFAGIAELPLYVGISLFVSVFGSTAIGLSLSLAVHIAMKTLEPQSESFHHTFRTILYSFGPAVTLAIPLAGLVITPVWMTITAIQGVRAVHRTSGLIAAVAVLWLPMLLVLSLLLLP